MLIAVATLGRPLRLANYGRTLWRGRQLSRAFAHAQLALGERMFAAGIDDGETGEAIAALEKAIRRAQAAGEPCQALRAEWERLVRRLADAALEDDGPLPGADAEYAAARKVLVLLKQHRSALLLEKSGAGQSASKMIL